MKKKLNQDDADINSTIDKEKQDESERQFIVFYERIRSYFKKEILDLKRDSKRSFMWSVGSIIVSFIGIVLALTSLYLYIDFGTVAKAEIQGKTLVLTDFKGKSKFLHFNSEIKEVLLCNLKGSPKNKEVVIYFYEYGDDKNLIKAFDHSGNPLWTYDAQKDSSLIIPYSQVESLITQKIQYFSHNGDNQLAILMNDFTWFPSVFLILSSNGKLLKYFWHTGRLLEFCQFNNKFVLSGVNNDLERKDTEKGEYTNVILCIDYDTVAEAFPFRLNIDWYYYLKPPDYPIRLLDLKNNDITFWAGPMRFTVDEQGNILDSLRGDSYKENEHPSLIRYNFIENREIK